MFYHMVSVINVRKTIEITVTELQRQINVILNKYITGTNKSLIKL